ncbi:MAG: hypothetical protein [Microvirus sp.]|nr:MAG: hypothetical protein [Microvirus sp.]
MNQRENLPNVENLPWPKPKINPFYDNNSSERRRGKTLTIPDQSLSVKQILERFTRGQRIPDAIAGYYDAENDPLELNGTNIETLDLSEKYDILERLRRQNKTLQSRFKAQEDKRKEDELIRTYVEKNPPKVESI